MNRLLIALIAVLFVFVSCKKEEAPQEKTSSADNVIAEMDTGKDGTISHEEWMAHFKVKDKDGNGVISKEEMREHHIKIHGDDSMFEKAFAMSDKDGDSNINEDECEQKFKAIDADNSGDVSKDEIEARMVKMK